VVRGKETTGARKVEAMKSRLVARADHQPVASRGDAQRSARRKSQKKKHLLDHRDFPKLVRKGRARSE